MRGLVSQTLFSKFPPPVTALLLQAVSVVIVLSGILILDIHTDSLFIAFGCGVLAATFTYFIGLARWWLVIQLIFAPALLLTLRLDIPAEFFLAAFLLMLLVYWSSYRSQVPLYLSSTKVWKTLEELLPVYKANSSFKFADIGSGMGGVLTYLAKARPDGEYYGVENAPLPLLLSQLRVKLGNHTNCHIQWQSLWLHDLSPYDVVFAYLSPVPMEQLWKKVKQEMRSGTLFVSSTFDVPGHAPHYSITLDDMHHSTLYVFSI